jgi:ribulose-5-phosphate 4-epimerase/fuculose-1-phosphate aldolase
MIAGRWAWARRGLVASLAALWLFAASARADEASDRTALIDDLVTANHILYHQGVLDGFGHVSVRDPTRPDHFLMSHALGPGAVAAADIMAFDLDGKPVDASDHRSSYSERFIHAEIYRVRADVNAVVHSHSPTVIPFSVTQVPLRPVMTTAAALATGVPVFEMRNAAGMTNMLVNDPAKGRALAQTLGQNAVALLRGHGDVVVGPDIYIVVSRAIYNEEDARLQIQALALGGPVTYLAPEEAALVEKARVANVRGSAHGQDRTWEMWKAEAMGKAGR